MSRSLMLAVFFRSRNRLEIFSEKKENGNKEEEGYESHQKNSYWGVGTFTVRSSTGWFNIGAYNRGMMSGKTPNLDKLAAQGMMFTDYYAEASCTAGRASFITGEIPLRTGLTTVGQAGADVGMPDQAATIALALKARATRPTSLAKTTSATSTNISRVSTASMNFSATSTISMRCPTPTGSITRRIG